MQLKWKVKSNNPGFNKDVLYSAEAWLNDNKRQYWVSVYLDKDPSEKFWKMACSRLFGSDPSSIASRDYYSLSQSEEVLKIAEDLIEKRIASDIGYLVAIKRNMTDPETQHCRSCGKKYE